MEITKRDFYYYFAPLLAPIRSIVRPSKELIGVKGCGIVNTHHHQQQNRRLAIMLDGAPDTAKASSPQRPVLLLGSSRTRAKLTCVAPITWSTDGRVITYMEKENHLFCLSPHGMFCLTYLIEAKIFYYRRPAGRSFSSTVRRAVPSFLSRP